MSRLKRLAREIHRRSLWQAAVAYLAASLAVLEAVDLFADRFGLPDWLFLVALGLLVVGLPVGIGVMLAVEDDAEAATTATDPGARRTAPEPVDVDTRTSRQLTWRTAAGALVIAAAVWGVVAAGWLLIGDPGQPAELRARALAEIPRLVEAGEYDAAYAVAKEARAVLPDDSVLNALWPTFAAPFSLETVPPGATVLRRPYGDGSWERLGETPLDSLWLPAGASRFRVDRDGYRARELADFAVPGFRFHFPTLALWPTGEAPDETVWVPGGELTIESPGLEHVSPVTVADFFLGRNEVTNREYQRFVDAGGYGEARWWSRSFADDDGTSVPFDAAMARFRDRTGRPGPATWAGGTYPPGTEDHPVAGVSWYEADAYARFAGRALPTVYHWYRGAFAWLAPYMVPRSNFGGEGPVPVGSRDAITRYGVQDMAGNVREWLWNESRGKRYIAGGGWDDESYMFIDSYTMPPMNRAPANGIRLAFYPDSLGLDDARAAVDDQPFRDFYALEPVPDDVYRHYLRLFEYDRTPLDAVVQETDTAQHWIRQRVTVDAAYGGERLLLQIYLPRRAEPPFQTVVYFPGSSAIVHDNSDMAGVNSFDFVVQSGRAVILPVLKGTYERGDELDSDVPEPTVFYRDHVVMWAKDIARAIDYAEERADLDADRLAYYGLSWGGRMGGLMVAVEPRFDAAVLYVAGLKFQAPLPEADPFHYVPRITIPTLMLNGRHDHFFPLETSQKPMFDLLGTPPDRKRHVVYDGGHFVPRARLVEATLGWLEDWLGEAR